MTSQEVHTESGVESLDLGIRDVVLFLNGKGVNTFTSCEGGKGHGFFHPTIRFVARSWEEAVDVGKILYDAGCRGFIVKFVGYDSFLFGDDPVYPCDTYGEVEGAGLRIAASSIHNLTSERKGERID